MTDKNETARVTHSDRVAAYSAGHTQGKIVRNSGRSADAYGPGKRWEALSWEWHEGYHDALNGIYEPERMPE